MICIFFVCSFYFFMLIIRIFFNLINWVFSFSRVWVFSHYHYINIKTISKTVNATTHKQKKTKTQTDSIICWREVISNCVLDSISDKRSVSADEIISTVQSRFYCIFISCFSIYVFYFCKSLITASLQLHMHICKMMVC